MKIEIKSNTPDVVLSDVTMESPLAGVKLAQPLQTDPNYSKIPVIMVSSIDSSEYARMLPDIAQIPIEAWVRKPIYPEHLLKTIQRFLVRTPK